MHIGFKRFGISVATRFRERGNYREDILKQGNLYSLGLNLQNHTTPQPHACVNTSKDGNIFQGCLTV